MKVTLVTTYPPQPCGVGVYASRLAAGYRANGVTVTILAENEIGVALKGNAQELRCWDRHTYDAFQLAQRINEVKSDFVEIQHEFGIWPDTPKLAVLILLIKAPIIVTVHTARAEGHQALWQALTQAEAKVIVHSTAMLASCPIAATLLPHPTPAVGQLTTYDSNGPFVSPGFISRSKGLDMFIKALARVNFHWTYIIAGEALSPDSQDYLKELHNLTAALGLTDRVRFITRFLDEQERWRLIQSARAVLLNQYTKEPIPSVSGAARDVIAARRPSISSRSYLYDDLDSSISGKFTLIEELTRLLESQFWSNRSWWEAAGFEGKAKWTYEMVAKARLALTSSRP